MSRFFLRLSLKLSIIKAFCLAWLAAVSGGMLYLAAYSNQGNLTTDVPVQLDVGDIAVRKSYKLLMFVHPRCPCSVASLRELSRVMARCEDTLETTVYMYCPEEAGVDWPQGRLWQLASATPGVEVQLDRGGKLAHQFGSTNSGHVLLYDRSGNLRFQGGITSARGHEGDNLGKNAVLTVVKEDLQHVGSCPVFGCSLQPLAAQFGE